MVRACRAADGGGGWRRRWTRTRAAARLAGALGLHPLAARVLAARGLGSAGDAQAFLAAPLEDLPDPSSMKGMPAAVDRLVARDSTSGERIACYGDYDVDGVTSTALLLAGFLRAAGADVVTYVPHRLVEGYGLNIGGGRRSSPREGVRLLVTLDCGITERRGGPRGDGGSASTTVVVDHHTVPVELPRRRRS